MEKKQNVPALRFQGFSGEWEKKTLGDFGNVAMNRRIFKEQTSETGEIPFYKIGTFGKEPDAYISRQLFEEYKAKYPYPDVGDILLSAAGSIGKTVEYTGKDEYFQDSNIVWLKHDERLDNPFLKYFYSKVKWGTLEGGTVKRLYNKILLETEIVLPEIIEQKKIGKFFASYDRMLAHQEGKIRKLQQFRQAMLTKLFPREGAAEPELRFRGFSGKWEQCTAKKIFESKDDRNHPDLPVLTATQEYGMVRRDRINYNVGHDKRNEVGYKRVLPGQFVIHLRSFQGGFAHSPLEGITSPAYTVIAFRDERKHDEYFWKYVFLSESFIKRLSTVTYGIRDGRSISFEDFRGLQLCFPSKEEQAKIGAVLRKIDSFISLQQKKLERMQRLKAALLEKLFV